MSSPSSRNVRPSLPPNEYTVGWISALPIESAAASEILDEDYEGLTYNFNDLTNYTLGRIGGHAVVISCLPAGRIGTTPAAVIATRMTSKYPSVQIGLIVGIGGGNPSTEDIRLGDVVVSQPQGRYGGVIYNMGKETREGFEEMGHLNAPPEVLLQALATAQTNFFQDRSRHSDYLAVIEERNPRFHRAKAGADVLHQLVLDSAGVILKDEAGVAPRCGS